jgi:hypothetical protein
MKYLLCLSILFSFYSCSSYEKQPTPEQEYLSNSRRACADEDMAPTYNCFIEKKDHDTLSYFSDDGVESKELKFKNNTKSH